MAERRLNSLDFLKGLAVIFMMIQHFSVWFVDPAWLDGDALAVTYPFYMFMNLLGGYSAPAFITISGMGAWFFMRRDGAVSAILRRGLLILGAGYLLNLACPVWFNPGSWYVLHLIGAMMLTVPLLKKAPLKLQFVLIIVVLAAALLLQSSLRVPLHMGNKEMNDISQPGGALRLALVGGHFPLLPWAAFFMLGFACAPLVEACRERQLLIMSAVSFAVMGLLGAAKFAVPVRGAFLKRLLAIPSSFYPLWPVMVFLLAGGVLLSVALVRIYERRHPLRDTNAIVIFGQFSLSAFLIHVVLFKQLLSLTPLYRKIPFAAAFAASYAIIAIFMVIAFFWKRINFRFSFEWLLRKLA